MDRPKKLLFSAVMALGVLVLLEVIAQGVAAIAPDALTVAPADPGDGIGVMMQPDTALLWKLSPGEWKQGGVMVRINEQGLRGMPIRARPDEQRVLFTGDSSVFGWAVREEQAFAWQVEAKLRHQKVRTINAGVPGYSSAQSRFQIEAMIEELAPDVLVIGNLWSDMMRTGWSDTALFARFGEAEHARALQLRGVLGRSALFRLAQSALLSLRPLPADRRILWNTVMQGGEGAARSRSTPHEHRDNIEAIAAMAQEHGAAVVSLILPVNRSGEHPPAEYLAPYHSNLRAVGAAGAGCVDMPLAWEALSVDDIAVRFVDRVHPSAQGHQEIAEALVPVIEAALAGR